MPEKKAKRHRTVINITMDPDILRDMRKHCDRNELTYSGYIEDLVLADLDRLYPMIKGETN